YAVCYTKPELPSTERAQCLAAADVAQELLAFSATVAESPSVVDGFKLWQKLFSVTDSLPSGQGQGIGAISSIGEAVKRLKAFIGHAARIHIKHLVQHSDNFQEVVDSLNKDFSSEPFPKNLQTLLVTVSKGNDITEKSFDCKPLQGDDNAEDLEVDGPKILPFLSQFTSLGELNMSFLKEIFPEKHDIAVKFIDTFKEAVK
ncbi:unnamed protein product, partial [Durusdinium trenchii]